MSISAMKQALDLLETSWGDGHEDTLKYWNETAQVLRQAIVEAEKQEPVAFLRKGFAKWEPLYDAPIPASDISQEPVDKTAKDRHEFKCPRCGHCCRDGLERLCRLMGTFDLATGHADTIDEALDALELELRDVLGHLRARREWVGLTDDEIEQGQKESWVDKQAFESAVWWAEAKLKEKNNG